MTCHRTGGIGPFPMNSHAVVQGFSPMIREVILTRRMPPWHADPHVGTFEGARSLTKEQAQTLVHWIEAGSPRGEGPDPLAEMNEQWPEWVFGEPDLVVTLPAFDVPATGTIDYQRHRSPTRPAEMSGFAPAIRCPEIAVSFITCWWASTIRSCRSVSAWCAQRAASSVRTCPAMDL